MKKDPEQKIIFFDGVCHLCNRFVDFVILHDPDHQFLFAPLQGETAARLLSPEQRQNLQSVIYAENSQIFEQSQAVLKIFRLLPYPYKILAFSEKIIPGSARDAVYQLVAKNRYRWFGEKESCRIPTDKEKSQFLP
jgi:predicted DCC family thiol-disulfide oxidoreductase YuxK